MPLFYKARQIVIPKTDGEKLFYPVLVKVGKMVTTQKLGELIADKSSLTPGDVHNVVRNLMSVMREQLLNSRSVMLDGLGSFTVIAVSSGNGVDKSDDVGPAQIKRLKVRFNPTYTRPVGAGGITRAMFSEVEYERWNGANASATGDENGGDGGDGGYEDPTG